MPGLCAKSDRSAVFEGSSGAGKRAQDAKLAKDLDKSIFYKRLIVRSTNNLARLDRVIVLVPQAQASPAAAPKAQVPADAKPIAKPEPQKEPLP